MNWISRKVDRIADEKKEGRDEIWLHDGDKGTRVTKEARGSPIASNIDISVY